MTRRSGALFLTAAACLTTIVLRGAVSVHGAVTAPAPAWDRQAAARYLDARELWWQKWPKAQKDHGTVCISCHTNVPYAMVRPMLGRQLGETSESATETRMMASVETRVQGWAEMETFYSDDVHGPGKTAESRATEAVLNAAMLASYDAQTGHLRPITQMAFNEAWKLQESTGDRAGGWKWQDFHLAPWEAGESAYQGAALLMVEAVNAPDGLAVAPANRAHLDLLRDYLRRDYATEPVLDQLYVLWASTNEPGLLTVDERKALLSTLSQWQQTDGGWRTAVLDNRQRNDHTPEPTESDGYATGLAVLAMEESGVRKNDPSLKRATTWLTTHQQKNGAWAAASINKQRDPASAAYLFMSDAATAYATLALERAK